MSREMETYCVSLRGDKLQVSSMFFLTDQHVFSLISTFRTFLMESLALVSIDANLDQW